MMNNDDDDCDVPLSVAAQVCGVANKVQRISVYTYNNVRRTRINSIILFYIFYYLQINLAYFYIFIF